MSKNWLWFECTTLCCALLGNVVILTMTHKAAVASKMNLQYSREAETFLKSNGESESQMYCALDGVDRFGYGSLTSMFDSKKCTTDSA